MFNSKYAKKIWCWLTVVGDWHFQWYCHFDCAHHIYYHCHHKFWMQCRLQFSTDTWNFHKFYNYVWHVLLWAISSIFQCIVSFMTWIWKMFCEQCTMQTSILLQQRTNKTLYNQQQKKRLKATTSNWIFYFVQILFGILITTAKERLREKA